MKIDSSVISMQAASSSKKTVKETSKQISAFSNYKLSSQQKNDLINSSPEENKNGNRQIQNSAARQILRPRISRILSPKKMSAKMDMHLQLLEQMMSAILKRKFKIQDLSQLETSNQQLENFKNSFITEDSSQNQTIEAQTSYLTEISVYSSETTENQSFSFSASVNVKTADGREIKMDLELNMSSEFKEKIDMTSIRESKVKLCDPLVVNYAGMSADLSSEKMRFDLDCDGKEDQVSKLMSGSGFLALDKNADGKVNDGTELFGAKSGNGFKDLAVYDDDKNGWIDENDDIFNKLRIWSFDDQGKESLVALGEIGIGAICLTNVAASFGLRGDEGLNGVIQNTGIFLNENGTGGTVQHVDFAI